MRCGVGGGQVLLKEPTHRVSIDREDYDRRVLGLIMICWYVVQPRELPLMRVPDSQVFSDLL